MELCKALGSVKYDIVTEHKICILRGDSGTGKSLLLRTLNAYFAVCGKKCLYVDYNNYQSLPSVLSNAADYDYIFLDNADLYYKEMEFDILLRGKAECFIASRDLGLVDFEQMGFYLVTYKNDEIYMREEKY